MFLGTGAKVPVTIITGQLGAGKTTLLTYILKVNEKIIWIFKRWRKNFKLPYQQIFNFQFKTEPAWNDEDILVFLSENGLFLWKDLLGSIVNRTWNPWNCWQYVNGFLNGSVVLILSYPRPFRKRHARFTTVPLGNLNLINIKEDNFFSWPLLLKFRKFFLGYII